MARTAEKKAVAKKVAKKKAAKKKTTPRKSQRKPIHPAITKAKTRPKNEDRDNYVGALEQEEMFQLWCQIRDKGKGGGYKGVGTKLGRDTKTVRRISERNKWHDRFDKIMQDVFKATNQKVKQEQVSNLRLARLLRNKVCSHILRPNYKITPSVSDAINTMRFEDELSGNLPDPGKSALAAKNSEQLEKALALIDGLDPKSLAKLAEDMADAGTAAESKE